VLILENRGLGYRLKILLQKYKFNILTILVHYEGQIVYEPLVPGDEEEKLLWAKNRLKAYYGSEMHFLRAMYNHKLNDEGYYFNIVHEVNKGLKGGVVRAGISDSVMAPRSPIYNRRIKMHTIVNYDRILDSATSTLEQPVLKYDGDLEVKYIMEPESRAYQKAYRKIVGKSVQISVMKLLNGSAIVQSNGQPYPLDALETSGYWSWELMAENLPTDYTPDDDLKLIGQP
jgi:hypothetical protein